MTKCFFHRPSGFNPIDHGAGSNAKQTAKELAAPRYSTNRIIFVVSFVLRLFKRCGPSAICRLVIAVIVDTINHLSLGLYSHVSKEVFKVGPSLANRNSTSTIIIPGGILGIGASGNHVFPGDVSWRMVPAWSMTVRSGSFRRFLALKAAAGKGVPTAEVAVQDISMHSAGTQANTCPDLPAIWEGFNRSIGNDFKPSRSESDEIKFLRHNVAFSMLCSVVGVRRQPALTAINVVNMA